MINVSFQKGFYWRFSRVIYDLIFITWLLPAVSCLRSVSFTFKMIWLRTFIACCAFLFYQLNCCFDNMGCTCAAAALVFLGVLAFHNSINGRSSATGMVCLQIQCVKVVVSSCCVTDRFWYVLAIEHFLNFEPLFEMTIKTFVKFDCWWKLYPTDFFSFALSWRLSCSYLDREFAASILSWIILGKGVS
jgi:hypothetical protein